MNHNPLTTNQAMDALVEAVATEVTAKLVKTGVAPIARC
jgi:hypothetical protein